VTFKECGGCSRGMCEMELQGNSQGTPMAVDMVAWAGVAEQLPRNAKRSRGAKATLLGTGCTRGSIRWRDTENWALIRCSYLLQLAN
jgi:hypothetical protein